MTHPARAIAVAIATLFAGGVCVDAAHAQFRGAQPMAPSFGSGSGWHAPAQPPQRPTIVDALGSTVGGTPARRSCPDGAMPDAAEPAAVDPAAAAAAEFQQVRVAGRALKDAVRRVVDGLDWYEDLDDALAAGAAAGRPVLWLDALGDLEGFA